jgi:membrane peptidoglycan carboxypeptidase
MALQEAINILPFVNSIKDLETWGYKIYTTVNNEHQELAINAINSYKRNKNNAQFALTAVNPNNNKIMAIVGGTDYNKSSLNRALGKETDGRQPGSSIKPYIYYQAMLNYNPEDTVDDSPFCSGNYCPKNYGGNFSGKDTLQNHLARSRNIPAIKIGQTVGIKNVIKTMRSLGITSKLENIPSFPLGSNNLTFVSEKSRVLIFD